MPGLVNELLLILEAVLMPMLVTSILAELMVNKGNKHKRTYSGHQSREVINAQAEQKWNVVDKEITMAWEEYMRSDEIKEKAEKMRQETSKTWRRKGQPVVRTPSALKNKPMLLLLQRQRRVRLAKITPDVQKGTKQNSTVCSIDVTVNVDMPTSRIHGHGRECLGDRPQKRYFLVRSIECKC